MPTSVLFGSQGHLLCMSTVGAPPPSAVEGRAFELKIYQEKTSLMLYFIRHVEARRADFKDLAWHGSKIPIGLTAGGTVNSKQILSAALDIVGLAKPCVVEFGPNTAVSWVAEAGEIGRELGPYRGIEHSQAAVDLFRAVASARNETEAAHNVLEFFRDAFNDGERITFIEKNLRDRKELGREQTLKEKLAECTRRRYPLIARLGTDTLRQGDISAPASTFTDLKGADIVTCEAVLQHLAPNDIIKALRLAHALLNDSKFMYVAVKSSQTESDHIVGTVQDNGYPNFRTTPWQWGIQRKNTFISTARFKNEVDDAGFEIVFHAICREIDRDVEYSWYLLRKK
jgi:hypothetical protein